MPVPTPEPSRARHPDPKPWAPGPTRGTRVPKPAPSERGEDDLGNQLRRYELEAAELRRTITLLTEKVNGLHTLLTETVNSLQGMAPAPQLQESMRSLTESVRILTPESTAEASIQALNRAQVVITHSRSYWRIDGSRELDERLAAVEHQVMDMRARREVPPNGASTVVAAVAKIGAATVFGACVGAPIGAFIVGDAIVKEMVKTAITGFIVQTAMELTELGIDHVRRES